MTVGAWVIIGVVLFILGNVMGLKPKASEVRVGEVRLFARKIGLNPKLIALPEWLAGNKMLGKNGMIAQYAVINDDWRLPAQRFIWADGWQAAGDIAIQSIMAPPTVFMPYIKGLSIKANSVILYWQDESYIASFDITDKQAMTKITQDLEQLQQFLSAIGKNS